MPLHREDYELAMTGHSMPESYDVFLDGQRIGHLRTRWGEFFAAYDGDQGYEHLLDAKTEGYGDFEPNERNHFLNLGIAIIDRRHHEGPFLVLETKPEDPMGWSMKART